MLFWEVLIVDNLLLVYIMFVRYLICFFFIWIEMKVCVLVYFIKVVWEVDWYNELGKINLLFEKLCLFYMIINICIW